MRILIATTAQDNSTQGNQITAARWSELLSKLDHKVSLVAQGQAIDGMFDCLIALHATRNHKTIVGFRETFPDSAIVVVLTGTDLHIDLCSGGGEQEMAEQSLEIADRIIVLEPASIMKLSEGNRKKAVVILQSAERFPQASDKQHADFVVAVVGHLRPIKDPFAAAEAARWLPSDSKIRIVQWGAALEPEMAQLAKAEMKGNPRYQWLGELDHENSQRRLAAADVMVISSLAEGGPSVVSEAIVNSVPIIAHRITATVGLLGEDYPGFYHSRDRQQLSELLSRAECAAGFLAILQSWIDDLKPRFTVEAESNSLRKLLDSL